MPKFLLPLCALVLLTACQRDAVDIPKNAAADPQLRSYQVPPERADDLARALSNLLSIKAEGVPALGGVRRVGEGTLLVLAPVGVHPSIGEAIDDVLAQQSAKTAAPTSSVLLRLWIIEEAAADASGLPALPELAPALEAIQQQFPLQQVRLVDAASMQLWGSEYSIVITGRKSTIESRLQQRVGQRSVEVAINNGGLQVKSQVPLALGKYLVLAEVGAEGEPLRRRFVVMHASETATN